MDPENAIEENRRLRRTMRDIVSLSTLPAIWIGLGLEGIACNLAEVLLNTLSLELIYVRLPGLGRGRTEVVRTKHRSDHTEEVAVRASVAGLLEADETDSAMTIVDPVGGGTLHAAVTRFRVGDDYGVLVSGSRNADFPTEQDRLLLGVGANQTAIVIQRRQAEEQVREQREWLRVTLSSIGDAVIATDTQERVTYLNEVAQQLTGWTQEDAEGMPLVSVFPILNEQTRRPIENPVEKVLREGVVVGLANHTILIAKDGEERPIDDSAAPIKDAAGKIIGVVLTFRDVTEQRRVERDIRQSEARNRAILEGALDCVITMDHEGKVIEFNPAAEKTFGYSRYQVIGEDLSEFIIPQSLRERHRAGMAHYLATGEGFVLGKRLELPALRADGTEFPAEISIVRIWTDGPPLFTAYLRDITEQKRVEKYRNARLAVTHALSAAATVEEGAREVLRAVCENLGWDVGFVWNVNNEGDRLVCRASWGGRNPTVIEFERVSCSLTFERGEGLLGQVWSSMKPAWILDVSQDTSFPRPASALQCGLHSTFAYPIVVGDRMVGVIELFKKRIRESDADLLEMMGTVAGNIGQFIERRGAEEDLQRSEQELADFFENATIALQWVGADGIILRANRAELDMLGYSREEYIGRSIADFHVDEDVISEILSLLKAGETLDEEYPARLRCKDGSIKDVLIDTSGLWRDSKFVHSRCFTRDVTERKQAEAKVRAQEQRTRTILESITDAFCSFDHDWRFIYVNQEAEKLLGRSRDSLIGKNHWEEYPDTLGTDLERNYRRAASENVTVKFELFSAPHGLWYEINAYPSQEGLSVYFKDISQQRRVDAVLRESEEKLRLLADTIPQLAWMARADGYIFWYNRGWYEYTGTTPDQMSGWGWQSVHDPAVLPAVLERWKGSITSGEPFEMVFPLKGADNQFRPFLTRVNPLRDEQGRILNWFGTNTDISDIKRMEEELRDADRRKDEFLATLAHELRNPLAPIRNSLNILRITEGVGAGAQQLHEMMDRQVAHMVRLVDDLLQLSRISRGKIELQQQNVDISVIINHAVETSKPFIEAAGHHLTVSLPTEPLTVNGDLVRLAQVFANLLNNSAKYTNPGGRITLTGRREGSELIVSVRDTGIGIPRGMLDRVFEMFAQVNNELSRTQDGLGIGLNLVRNLVTMHGGSVEAHSTGLGHGSEFIVRLPLSVTSDAESLSAPLSSTNEQRTPPRRILVVDDNRDAADSLGMLLKFLGADIHLAYDGPSALDAIRIFRPSVVLLDLGLPGMNGFEVARQIRQMPNGDKLRMIALTGWSQEEDRRRSEEAGFDHHLVKPVSLSALQGVLASQAD